MAADQNRLYGHLLLESPFWASVENHGRPRPAHGEVPEISGEIVTGGRSRSDADITRLGANCGHS
jgi:hypothetical protein